MTHILLGFLLILQASYSLAMEQAQQLTEGQLKLVQESQAKAAELAAREKEKWERRQAEVFMMLTLADSSAQIPQEEVAGPRFPSQIAPQYVEFIQSIIAGDAKLLDSLLAGISQLVQAGDRDILPVAIDYVQHNFFVAREAICMLHLLMHHVIQEQETWTPLMHTIVDGKWDEAISSIYTGQDCNYDCFTSDPARTVARILVKRAKDNLQLYYDKYYPLSLLIIGSPAYAYDRARQIYAPLGEFGWRPVTTDRLGIAREIIARFEQKQDFTKPDGSQIILPGVILILCQKLNMQINSHIECARLIAQKPE